jgi:hypothetical protein
LILQRFSLLYKKARQFGGITEMSKGEIKITQILNKSRLLYEREKTFSDLKHGKFRFDFYIKNVYGTDCIIEFNGEQHYQFVGKFYKS